MAGRSTRQQALSSRWCAMLELKISGTRAQLFDEVCAKSVPIYKAEDVIKEAQRLIGAARPDKEVWDEQAAAIAVLARQYDKPTANILELGAYHGYSAAILKLAAPSALVTTLEPDPTNRQTTRANIVDLGVVVRPEQSTAYLALTENGRGKKYDLIFVDGDHKRIRDDLPWFNRLKIGGLFLHHDYSPLESARPCPPVYEALNEFAAKLGREPDVLVVDDTGVGLAGWYRRPGETWEPDA